MEACACVGALDLVGQTERMVSHIRNTFMKVILNSSWVGSKSFAGAIQKLDDIVVNVGSPGRRLDVAFIENHFRPLGDVPVDRLFPSWIKALSISAHYVWSDQETPLYDEEEVTARYFNNFNIVIIPTALIHQPLMYPDGPIAMNYGGLGMIIAHEMMHSLGVRGIEDEPWATKEFLKNYTERVHCLRKSHKSVLSLSRRQEALDDTLDSENLADLVGTSVAYKAFTSLVPEDVGYTLPGLDMSAEQLFFVMNCAKWCSQYSVPGKRYAPFRSRCIVPLMNMDEFASAFRCALGTPMNPPGKCFFW
ncbi:neprilysin-1-like [Rhipicephalus sanguineus]|uniref:neprilysin-1-like n=1 Tax=Rhipicephalus sanguineus TaxID=34632 RepID=UPI0020C2CD72|nr:neprilysin-1-like [Rhipicephalus sanguineus]